PVAASFVSRRTRRRTRFRSKAPESGMPVCPGGAVPTRSLADPPSALKDIRIIEADYGKRVIGVMSARRGRLLTAVLACRVLAFSLLDPDAQERRLARWGLVLSGGAGAPIRRIQGI